MAAEEAALALCVENGLLQQLIVVPDMWKGMMGDDWLNNGVTRDRFGSYIESELDKEINANIHRMHTSAKQRAINYRFEVVVGKPDAVLLETCSKDRFELVVAGSCRPKGKAGIKSKLLTDSVVGKLPFPLLVVPYPHE